MPHFKRALRAHVYSTKPPLRSNGAIPPLQSGTPGLQFLPRVGVFDMTIFLSWTSPRSAFLKKNRSILLQHIFYQLQFWRRRINILYSAIYIHISVNSAVELLSRDTALIDDHKSTLFASTLKPCRFKRY